MRETKHMCMQERQKGKVHEHERQSTHEEETKPMKGKAHTRGKMCERSNVHARKTTRMRERNACEGGSV